VGNGFGREYGNGMRGLGAVLKSVRRYARIMYKGRLQASKGVPRTYGSFIASKIVPTDAISKAFIGSELVWI
jgi:hypothetical protein